MNTYSIVGVWLTVVGSVVAETFVYYLDPGEIAAEVVIGVLATATALVTMLFSMGLKDEQRAVRYMLVVPVGLLAVLIVTMLLAYQVSF
jgi:hypothetical protein